MGFVRPFSTVHSWIPSTLSSVPRQQQLKDRRRINHLRAYILVTSLQGQRLLRRELPNAFAVGQTLRGRRRSTRPGGSFNSAQEDAPREKLRLWATGDFPAHDVEKCLDLRDAVRGLKAWGYTHHQAVTPNRLLKDDGWWARYILECKIQGTTVNVSTESEHMVDAYAELGIPTVLAVDPEHQLHGAPSRDARVQVCPHQISKSVNCHVHALP